MDATNPLRCAVLGAGSFGTCLAIQLAEHGHAVDLWARSAAVADAIEKHRRNPRYLTGFRLPESIRATSSLAEATTDKDLVLSVVPSHAVRETWQAARAHLSEGALVVSASKGIENGTGMLMSQVLADVLPASSHPRLVFLSGPSFAREVAEGRPTALSLAAHDETWAIAAQTLLSSPRLRCYTNRDVIGVELGGALKNVIAIAVGACDGLELGLNARAALITRGLSEMARLGRTLGADPLTFQGLSGMGDLVLTCTGELSRNRRVGLEIGRGRGIEEVLADMTQVAEGVRTARSVHELATRHGVELPICEAVFRVLHGGERVGDVAAELTRRQLRGEHD